MLLLFMSLAGGGTVVWAVAGGAATPFVWGNSLMAAMARAMDSEIER